ncbi:MAG: hypothetical protein IPJ49_25800 [Candidatus Obscuribacter sp.]|nr:hypothetical protein [Candidatus Obscuribacter sp.]
MTRALRFAVYIIAGLCALSALGYFYYDGYVRFPTLEDRAGFVKKLAENEQSWARYKLERMDNKDPRYHQCTAIGPIEVGAVKYKHPVLGVIFGEVPARIELDADGYKKLRKLACTSDVGAKMYANYHVAELAAANGLCQYVCGKSQNEVRELLGAPDYSADDIPLWEPLKPGIERWVYNLGLEPISVKLFFEKGLCTRGEICGRAEMMDLAQWLIYRITKTSIGKSVNVIVAKNGTPYQIEDSCNRQIKQHLDDETMFYFVSARRQLEVEIRHGLGDYTAVCSNSISKMLDE